MLVAFVEQMNIIEGGRAVGTQYRFALEEFSRYRNPESLAERVRSLKPSNDGQRIACLLFLRAFDRLKATGKTPYPQALGEWTALDKLGSTGT